jgi:spore coat polysaccharide biosynthesis protein SpsF
MKIVAVVPVRMNSARLPGKVMMPILGQPMLGHLLDRVRNCPLLDEIVVSTSVEVENDCIEEYCKQQDILVFRGSEDDVLDRLLHACLWRKAEAGVMIFGDGPLIDPQIITQVVKCFLKEDRYDLVGNDIMTSWPPGMEVETFNVSALCDAARRCTDREIREHGTLFIRQNPKVYTLHNVEAPPGLCRDNLSFEVDVYSDFQAIEKILVYFKGRVDISLQELICFMDDHPEVVASTSNVPRRWEKFREKGNGNRC